MRGIDEAGLWNCEIDSPPRAWCAHEREGGCGKRSTVLTRQISVDVLEDLDGDAPGKLCGYGRRGRRLPWEEDA